MPFIASEGQSIKQEMHELSILIEKARVITESDIESVGSTGSTEVHDDISAIVDSLGIYAAPFMAGTLNCLGWQNHSCHSLDFQILGPTQPYVLKVYDKVPLETHTLGKDKRPFESRRPGREPSGLELGWFI